MTLWSAMTLGSHMILWPHAILLLIGCGPLSSAPATATGRSRRVRNNSVCFAQTAALRRGGRALSEKRKGHEGVDGDARAVLVRCTFPAPTPPEPEREHGFFDAFEGIRVRPEGNACSGAGGGSKSGNPLTLLTPLARP